MLTKQQEKELFGNNLPGEIEIVGDIWKLDDMLGVSHSSHMNDNMFEDARRRLQTERQRREGVGLSVELLMMMEKQTGGSFCMAVNAKRKRLMDWLQSTLDKSWDEIRQIMEGE